MNLEPYLMMAAYGHVFLGCLLILAGLRHVLPWLLEDDHQGR